MTDHRTGFSAAVSRRLVQASAATGALRAAVLCLAGALSACGGNGGGGGGSQPPGGTVSGRVTFERVPFSGSIGAGLDYAATFQAPAREVEVELLRTSDGSVLATTRTDVDGRYSLPAPANTDVRVRAKALSRVPGTATDPTSWDLRVVNNTNGNALYVLDSDSFNTGLAGVSRNLVATTGWGGFAGTYTGVRAAAPFAVLDTLYAAARFVIASGDAAVRLSPLTAYWSPQNRPSDAFEPAIGNIQTTAYWSTGISGVLPGIYVLGSADLDTDEFDQHVVAHEFQHYFEDAVSRTDSIAGAHGLDERLDLRLAFSEGFANAVCAMVLDEPLYRDSFGRTQSQDSHFSVETRSTPTPGWYNESSVQGIVWDLYDTANDAEDSDAVSIGFGPMLDVFRDELRDGVPLTSLFSFITALKQRPAVPADAVDARVEAECLVDSQTALCSTGPEEQPFGIDSVAMDPYATTETHSSVAPTSADLVLPVYSPITLNGPSVRVCGDTELTQPDGSTISGTYNSLGNRRFLRFEVPSARTIDVRVTCVATSGDNAKPGSNCTDEPLPDPDLVLSQGQSRWISESETPFTERLQTDVNGGEAVLEVYEYSHVDLEAATRRGRTCLTVTITG